MTIGNEVFADNFYPFGFPEGISQQSLDFIGSPDVTVVYYFHYFTLVLYIPFSVGFVQKKEVVITYAHLN